MLENEDTPLDLMLRGFDRAVVKNKTGVDIGYNGRGLREAAAGVDRFAYKVEHVLGRLGATEIDAALEAYATGSSKPEVLAVLGLSGENITPLRKLFVSLGRKDGFAAANTAAKAHSMQAGMLAKHGVVNPFELPEVQAKAGDTREKKYGGRYTLSAGSSLAETARGTFSAAHGVQPGQDGLFKRDSHLDLVCRGFQREEVLHRSGFDIGVKGAGVRALLKGVDRLAYKATHVEHRYGPEGIVAALEAFAMGSDRQDVLVAFALNPGMSTTLCPLGKLFALLGYQEAFKRARSEKGRGC